MLRATAYALGIPFVEAFKHATKDRSASDSVVVSVVDGDGLVGWGEGAPRPYVTGEDVPGMLRNLQAAWPQLRDAADPLDPALLDTVTTFDGRAANATRAALELALLDLQARRDGQSVATVAPALRPKVTYGGVVTAGDVDKANAHARQMKVLGLRHVKVKVGLGDDVARVQAVRDALGPDAVIRIDTNGVWDREAAATALDALAALNIAAVEQPLPRGDIADWLWLKARSPIPLMIDESLVTYADGEAFAQARAADFFNVRVSKNGGLRSALALARLAHAHGIGIQVGSQVGETAILAAAGRHLACACPTLAFAEGSYGTLLLTEDLTPAAVRFGYRGEAPALTGPGLGVEIGLVRVEKWALQTVDLA